MSLHIIKLCVGAEDVEDLRTWQTARLKEKKKNKLKIIIKNYRKNKEFMIFCRNIYILKVLYL